ncbi:hypothetical protein A6R68_04245 [Neotoma lepida]|uniref:Uncharacterized protein n=1 Tax=Neotoma lepida TaxID=56216 RepID=A0A1A6GND0_NEOLE|nr:hypothetical protein A6R68_04245 [Neotoma lepida]
MPNRSLPLAEQGLLEPLASPYKPPGGRHPTPTPPWEQHMFTLNISQTVPPPPVGSGKQMERSSKPLQGKQKSKGLEPGPYCSSKGRELTGEIKVTPLSVCPCPWVLLASVPTTLILLQQKPQLGQPKTRPMKPMLCCSGLAGLDLVPLQWEGRQLLVPSGIKGIPGAWVSGGL